MRPRGTRDEAWFTATYAAQYADIVRYGRRRLADEEAAAELAQEVFVIAWRRRTEVPDRSLPWLYGVARRLLANRWRADRGTPPPLPMPPELATAADPAGITDVTDLRAALARLAEPDQEILRLIGWEELTVSEAAEVLGCTRTTAAVRLHRARRRLTAALTGPRAAVPSPQPVPGGRHVR
jgi:RNA polymerase sigma factor (sigma-70 family)